MATRTISASLTSPKDAILFDGDYIYYSTNPTHSGVVNSGTVVSAYVEFTNFRVYASSCYMSIYVGGQKVGETVEMDEEDYGNGKTVDIEVEMEALKPALLTATGEIEIHCYHNTDDDSNTYAVRTSGSCKITVTYSTPYLTSPGKPAFTQNADGTFDAQWTSSSVVDGSGSITYRLWNRTDGDPITSYTSETKITASIPYYGVSKNYAVEAACSGIDSSYSQSTPYTFVIPSISVPQNVRLSFDVGESTTIEWNASSITATKGEITYRIYKDGSWVADTTGLSYTFNKDVVSKWGTSAVSLTVEATAYTENPSYRNLSSGKSNSVSFTYKSLGATVGYYTGGRFVNCYMFQYSGGNWVKLVPKYYTGGGFVKCSTT